MSDYSQLQKMVLEVFNSSGPLARSTEQFKPRDGQTQMALAVAKLVEEGGSLVVEAGTGVGKTYAYLVPALLSGERILLSTATKTLQDQLFSRDLPKLLEVLNLPLRTALLKGRSSYLCQHRLDLVHEQTMLTDRSAVDLLVKVKKWAPQTTTGDLSDLPGLDERSSLIPYITSSRDNCMGSECSFWRECHVNQVRREAMAADIVVINHHLFFADLVVRESGMAEILPSVRVVIFDEAHQLNETGTQFLGQQITTGQLLDFTHDLLAAGIQLAKGLADWTAIASQVELATRDLRLTIGKHPNSTKLKWVDEIPEGIHDDSWNSSWDALVFAIEQAMTHLENVLEIAPDFEKLQSRATEVLNTISFFRKPCELGQVRWVDVTSQVRFVQSPLDIAQVVQSRMIQTEFVGSDEGQTANTTTNLPRSWIFTSATLGTDDQLSWFTQPCGLSQSTILKVDSPFDYGQQAFYYVPADMVEPKSPLHSEQVAVLSQQVARALGGRTLVLTTTLRALTAISDILKEDLDQPNDPEVLYQGQYPKRYLMDRFRQAIEPQQRGCVLVASASFWEGIDVPGEALQAVIIDKLPFPPPGDPMVEARSQRLTSLGKSPFNDYAMPEAAISLKQGAGRLIRRETDHGALIICDKRLITTGYGKRLLSGLPPMRRIQTRVEFDAAIQELTKFDTKVF